MICEDHLDNFRLVYDIAEKDFFLRRYFVVKQSTEVNVRMRLTDKTEYIIPAECFVMCAEATNNTDMWMATPQELSLATPNIVYVVQIDNDTMECKTSSIESVEYISDIAEYPVYTGEVIYGIKSSCENRTAFITDKNDKKHSLVKKNLFNIFPELDNEND